MTAPLGSRNCVSESSCSYVKEEGARPGPFFTFGWFTYCETMDRLVRAVGGGRRCVRAGSLAEFEVEPFAAEEKLLDGLAPVFFR